MGGLSRLDGMREKGNLLGIVGRGITSVEEGLGEVRGVVVIWVTADVLPPDGQRVGNGAYGG